VKEYVEYYNTKRPHPVIEQRAPNVYTIRSYGKIKSRPMLFGLNCQDTSRRIVKCLNKMSSKK
jgi:hypothetical protein